MRSAIHSRSLEMPPTKVAEHGGHVPMGRHAQPEELAPAYVNGVFALTWPRAGHVRARPCVPECF